MGAAGSRRWRHSVGIPRPPGPSATMLPTMAPERVAVAQVDTAVQSAAA
jgi:hypothetical protein